MVDIFYLNIYRTHAGAGPLLSIMPLFCVTLKCCRRPSLWSPLLKFLFAPSYRSHLVYLYLLTRIVDRSSILYSIQILNL
jgi:hypothetical protein